MINANTINYYDIVSENEFGRCRTIRYKQYMYSDILGKDGIPNYELCNYGCGPTSLATILSSEGYDYDPIEVAKLMYLDEFGNTLDFYTNRRNGRRGATFLGFLYVLQELARSNVDIEYQCKGNYILDFFSVNGTPIEGSNFVMPDDDVIIEGTFKLVFDETPWQIMASSGGLNARSFWYMNYGENGIEITVKVDDRMLCGEDFKSTISSTLTF